MTDPIQMTGKKRARFISTITMQHTPSASTIQSVKIINIINGASRTSVSPHPQLLSSLATPALANGSPVTNATATTSSPNGRHCLGQAIMNFVKDDPWTFDQTTGSSPKPGSTVGPPSTDMGTQTVFQTNQQACTACCLVGS